jgi:pyruvate/2-oxoglutarate/acetoin dehydrogenase E1 component
MNLADTIRSAMQCHMDAGFVCMGQNVGEGLGDTIPTWNFCRNCGANIPPISGEGTCDKCELQSLTHPNLITLPTSDCSNAGVACGYALAGKRPVLVVRFQGLGKVGLWPVLEYAAKSKAMWGVPCPVFVRAVATEGVIGPVCSGAQHGLAMRCPGVKVVAPMTPSEWTECWKEWQGSDDVVYCSEWRSSWHLTNDDLNDEWTVDRTAPLVLAIGNARIPAMKACKQNRWRLWEVQRLKPLGIETMLKFEEPFTKALVVDCEPTICGAAEHVAMELHRRTGVRVEVLALEDRVAGFSPESDVLTPSAEQIVQAVKRMEQL